eukprot:TRINITY_DN2692_c0_g1_i1.p1 TRINITY_DN2692_c0_g1~~TRINITY_DN2692_c0_g1_i1.p1  ORF type:complete len:290 (+),score=44.30 TRINITY_DN2692_c0_g1_i1:226-1095(+)
MSCHHCSMRCCCCKSKEEEEDSPPRPVDDFDTCSDHSALDEPLEYDPELDRDPTIITQALQASPQEWQALEQLWDLIPEPHDPKTDDAVLLRFLRARDLKVKKAHAMWTKWVHWRAEFHLDQLTEHEVSPELESGKARWLGQDLEGRPCILILPKFHDPDRSEPQSMVRFGVWLLEEGARKCDVTGLNGGSNQLCVIYDRRGMSMRNMDRKLFSVVLDLVDIAQDYYAERLGQVYVLGANWFYFTMWRIVRPFLSQRTKDKIIMIDEPREMLKFFESPDHLYQGWDEPF